MTVYDRLNNLRAQLVAQRLATEDPHTQDMFQDHINQVGVIIETLRIVGSKLDDVTHELRR